MQTPSDVLQQLDSALNPTMPKPKRTATQRKEDRNMQQDALTEARADLIAADEALAELQQKSKHLDSQIAAEREKFNDQRRMLEANHKALREQGADFMQQLQMKRETDDLATVGAMVEKSAYEQRNAMEARLKDAQAAVTKAEAAVALELLQIREAEYLARAEAAARAYWNAKRAAWTLYRKLGRTNAPDALRTGLFQSRFPRQLPFFTIEGAVSEGYVEWAGLMAIDVTQTPGIEDDLRS